MNTFKLLFIILLLAAVPITFGSVAMPTCGSHAQVFTIQNETYIFVTEQIQDCGPKIGKTFTIKTTEISLHEGQKIIVFLAIGGCSMRPDGELSCGESPKISVGIGSRHFYENNHFKLTEQNFTCFDISDCKQYLGEEPIYDSVNLIPFEKQSLYSLIFFIVLIIIIVIFIFKLY